MNVYRSISKSASIHCPNRSMKKRKKKEIEKRTQNILEKYKRFISRYALVDISFLSRELISLDSMAFAELHADGFEKRIDSVQTFGHPRKNLINLVPIHSGPLIFYKSLEGEM